MTLFEAFEVKEKGARFEGAAKLMKRLFAEVKTHAELVCQLVERFLAAPASHFS